MHISPSPSSITSDVSPKVESRRPQLGRDIERAVTDHMGHMLSSKGIHPWYVTMWLLRQYLPDLPLSKVGRFTGDRSAAQVRTATDSIDALMARDADAAAQINAMLTELISLDASYNTQLRRAQGRAWRQNRDQTVLAAMRKAEAAAAPPSKQPGDRMCLGCGKVFLSTWCGNRRCRLCTENNP